MTVTQRPGSWWCDCPRLNAKGIITVVKRNFSQHAWSPRTKVIGMRNMRYDPVHWYWFRQLEVTIGFNIRIDVDTVYLVLVSRSRPSIAVPVPLFSWHDDSMKVAVRNWDRWGRWKTFTPGTLLATTLL